MQAVTASLVATYLEGHAVCRGLFLPCSPCAFTALCLALPLQSYNRSSCLSPAQPAVVAERGNLHGWVTPSGSAGSSRGAPVSSQGAAMSIWRQMGMFGLLGTQLVSARRRCASSWSWPEGVMENIWGMRSCTPLKVQKDWRYG